MVFDQAQSPRLGQRTPIESTYVQIFDVDPDSITADLVEAAWPGQLIFRRDLSILQIFNGDLDAWEDVTAGIAGHLTFVGPEPPIANEVGDTWYDDDDGYKQYVWTGALPDGQGWAPITPTLPGDYGYIPADNITGGTFRSGVIIGTVLRTPDAPGGGHVEITPDGVRIIGPVDTTTLTPALSEFKGQAEVTNLTAKGNADGSGGITMRSSGNQVARGGKYTLANGVTAPTGAPTYNIDWAATPLTGYSFSSRNVVDLKWDATLSRWLVVVSGSGAAQMLKFTAAGAYDGEVGTALAYFSAGGAVAGVRAGTRNYYLMSPGAGDFYLTDELGTAISLYPLSTSSVFSMAYDGTNLIVAEFHTVAGSPSIKLYKYTASAVAGANLVTNPGFETTTSGWSVTGGTIARISVTNVISGIGSLQINCNSATQVVVSSPQWNVVPNTQYTFSADLKQLSVSGSAQVQVIWLDSGGVQISGTSTVTRTTTGTANTWSGTTLAPLAAAKAQIRVLPPKVTGNFVLDNVTMATAAGLNLVSSSVELAPISAQTTPANGLYIGNGDFGSLTWVLASATSAGNQALMIPDSTKTEDANNTFPLPPQAPVGIGYDGTSFWTLGSNAVLYKHESGNKFTTEGFTWWAASTLRDTVGGLETVVSPSVKITMKRRARLTVSTPPILVTGIGDPNAVGIYLARQGVVPVRSDLHLNGYSTVPDVVLTAATFTGAVPPATGTFPDANPAEFLSAKADGSGALIQLWGDGHGRLGSATWDTAGVWSGGATGTSILTGTVPPTSGVGVDGNFYLDSTAHILYGPKTSGTWPTALVSGTTTSEQTFSFASALSVWSCVHNLGEWSVDVETKDGTGAEVFGDLDFVSANQVDIHWYSPMTGTARVSR